MTFFEFCVLTNWWSSVDDSYTSAKQKYCSTRSKSSEYGGTCFNWKNTTGVFKRPECVRLSLYVIVIHLMFYRELSNYRFKDLIEILKCSIVCVPDTIKYKFSTLFAFLNIKISTLYYDTRICLLQ